MLLSELERKIEELQWLEELIKLSIERADNIRNEVKEEMLLREADELETDNYILRYALVALRRVDTTVLKPEIFYKTGTDYISNLPM